MWIPKTASAELDNFPWAEVKGRFSLSGGEFSMTIRNTLSLSTLRMWLVCCKGFEDYLPMAVNARGVLSADIVSPARACTASECKGSFISVVVWQ